MLIKLIDNLRPTNALRSTYIGRVLLTDVGQTDSNGNLVQLGRVKCYIQGLIEDVSDVNNLPWIYPSNSNMMGGAQTTGGMAVPIIGSYVKVEFPYDDIYAGFYTGNFIDPNTFPQMFNESYPNSYGMRDETNNYVKVNKTAGTVVFHHSSGAELDIDPSSEIRFVTSSGVRFISQDGQNQLYLDMLNGNMQMNLKNGFQVTGPLHQIQTSDFQITVDQLEETVNGAKVQQVTGAYQKQIGGSLSETVVGSVAKSNTGDYTKLVGGDTTYTFGTGLKETVALGDMEADLIAGDRTVNIILGDYNISLILGDYDLEIKAGDITQKTLAGELTYGNLLGSINIGLTGAITIKNNLGKFSLDATGAIAAENNLGQMTISAAGACALENNIGSVEIDPAGDVTISGGAEVSVSADAEATFAGDAITTVGGNGITNVDGTLVLLGGGGAPVARVGDQVMGIGNLGIPVISTIILGSFKVLSG
jgi:hypothetical protein